MIKVQLPRKRAKRYFLRVLVVLFSLFGLSLLFTYIYVSANKVSIIKSVTQSLSEKINGTVTIQDVDISFFRDFPTVSVVLNGVRITDSMIAVHKHPFLDAKKISARISVMRLIKKQAPVKGIRLIDASLYVFTDSTGYTNSYLVKGKEPAAKPTDTEKVSNPLTSLELQNVRLTLEDRRREKLHDIQIHELEVDLKEDETGTRLNVDASMLVHGLAFNLDRGTFLNEQTVKGDFVVHLDNTPKQLRFEDIVLRVADQRVKLTGRFELEGAAPQFQLSIATENIVYEKVKSLLPVRIARSLSMVEVQSPVTAQARLDGPLRGGDPLVNLNWQIKETRLTTPFMDFDEASFTGSFTNEAIKGIPRKDSNSRLVLNNFKALWRNIPVEANGIEIMNLTTPTLTCDLHSAFPLTTLNDVIGASSIDFLDGSAVVNMNYVGPIERNAMTHSYVNGSIIFKDGKINYTPRNVELKAVSGGVHFKNSDVVIKDLKSEVLNNKIEMNGFAKNLLTLINTGPNNVNLEWNVYSPSLNLNSFVYLLSKRKKVAARPKSKIAVSDMANKIDSVLDQGKVHVTLKADKVTYKKFDATNLQASVSLLTDQYIIHNVSMRHAGGGMNLSGALNSSQNSHDANLKLNVTDVDVQKLFRAFDNFGQQGVTAESLEGKLTANVTGNMRLSQTGAVIPSSVASTIDFSLKSGALIDYEPVKKMQRSIFKNRDFGNIRFAELKDRLEVKDREIKINRMEIQSSVLTMFIEGVYSQKGNSDLSIQVPISNLKKRDSTYVPTNLGVNKKAGRSIFIRGRPDTDGTIKFSLDLLNKYQKDKKAK